VAATNTNVIMKRLLLLDKQFNANTNDMWRTAMRRKWDVERTDPILIKEHIENRDYIRYYGNYIHAAEIEKDLPLTFTPIPPEYLANLRAYTNRKIVLRKYSELAQPIERNIFIKPVGLKWFEAKVYKKGETLDNGVSKPDDLIYTSEIIRYRNEVRCFVLNGEVLTSSEYIIEGKAYDTYDDLEPDDINFDDRLFLTPISDYVKNIYALCPKLPDGIVIDFGLTYDGEWQLLEFNEAWCSALYHCNNEGCLDVIINSVSDR